MPKFKIGDKVKVVRNVSDGATNCAALKGSVWTIVSIKGKEKNYAKIDLYFPDNGDPGAYEDNLELVIPETLKELLK